jgi:hypothetical protein
MATGKRTKATRRAVHYEATIRQLQASGDYRAALHKSWEWLSEEAAKVRRQRPLEAAAVDAEVTAKLTALAAHIPSYRPAGRVDHGAS